MPTVYPHSHLSDFDISLFLSGKHTRLYDKLGAFELEREGEIGTFFAVWAPNAEAVHVIGNFNFGINIPIRFSNAGIPPASGKASSPASETVKLINMAFKRKKAPI